MMKDKSKELDEWVDSKDRMKRIDLRYIHNQSARCYFGEDKEEEVSVPISPPKEHCEEEPYVSLSNIYNK